MPATAETPDEPFRDQDLVAAQSEVDQLREALASRACIDQLKGMVMAVVGCDADGAWSIIVRESQRHHVKIRDLAQRACSSQQARRAILHSVVADQRSVALAGAHPPGGNGRLQLRSVSPGEPE